MFIHMIAFSGISDHSDNPLLGLWCSVMKYMVKPEHPLGAYFRITHTSWKPRANSKQVPLLIIKVTWPMSHKRQDIDDEPPSWEINLQSTCVCVFSRSHHWYFMASFIVELRGMLHVKMKSMWNWWAERNLVLRALQ